MLSAISISMLTASLFGFDLPQGKNLIGSFHDPKLVLVDPQFLTTLSRREISAGMAEVAKHGMINDPELFRIVQLGWDFCKQHMLELISRAISVKIRIIERDPSEQGVRASLNLGHTIGHAVEAASGYKLLHGEAVAIGLVAETILAESLGIAKPGLVNQILPALSEMGLPVLIPNDIPGEEIIRAMRVDKKKASGMVRFALPVKIGEVKVGFEISDLKAALDLCSHTRVINYISDGQYSNMAGK